MAVALIYQILLLELFAKLVSIIGNKIIGNFAWDVYLKLSPLQNVTRLRVMKRRALDLYTQRSNISSKDQFAKWAKVDREYNKLRNEIRQLTDQMENSKTSFLRIVTSVIWFLTSGTKLFYRVYYRKLPVIWLPSGLLPGWLLWLLAFSSAPKGSVGVNAWLFITDAALSSLISFVKSVWALRQHKPVDNFGLGPGFAGEPIPVAVDGSEPKQKPKA